jgi:hypothetical protein
MPLLSRIAVFAQFFSVILSPAIAASVSQEYDYVIIGGGITGLVVANRLSEDKSSMFNAFVGDENTLMFLAPRRVHSCDREW